jgi:nucleoside-diphosphate-sugar epimerase
MIMEEVEKGQLTALIARAADFYGPDNKNSALSIMVADNLLKGKKAQAFGDLGKIHTYTYTPDAGKATALLGNTGDAYNQVWHLPTTKEKLSNRQWIELIAEELDGGGENSGDIARDVALPWVIYTRLERVS